MNPFDLGAEVFIVPTLWAITLITVGTMLFKAISRERTIFGEGTDDEIPVTSWKLDKTRARNAVLVFGAAALALSSLVVTPPGHRAAIYTTDGVDLQERGEGYSLIVPILHNANMVNVREQVYENQEVYAQTSDLLEVTMQIGVNYLITPDKAADLFRDVGQDYEAALIKPAVLDISKEQVGQIDALDFAKEREALSQAILAGLRARLEPVGISVTFVAVEDAIFNSAFVQAVLDKEIADEQAIESARLVEVARNEAAQVRARAEGDADAIALIAAAEQEQQTRLGLSPEEYVWFKKWDGILPSTWLTETGEFIVDLP